MAASISRSRPRISSMAGPCTGRRAGLSGSWIAWFEKYDQAKIVQSSGQAGRSFSLGTKPDGSFRVVLSRQEREDLIKATGGKVGIHGEGGTLGEVPIDKLSHDPDKPFEAVFPRLTTKSSARPEGTSRSEPRRKVGARQPPADKPLPLRTGRCDARTPWDRWEDLPPRGLPGQTGAVNLFTTWCGPCRWSSRVSSCSSSLCWRGPCHSPPLAGGRGWSRRGLRRGEAPAVPRAR